MILRIVKKLVLGLYIMFRMARDRKRTSSHNYRKMQYTLVYGGIHGHVYLGMNSPLIEEIHWHVYWGSGTHLCGIRQMPMYPNLCYIPVCIRCTLM